MSRLPLLLASLALLVLPATSGAATVGYAATISAEVEYDNAPGAGEWHTHSTVRSTLPGLTFVDGHLQPNTILAPVEEHTSGTYADGKKSCAFDGLDTRFGHASVVPVGGAGSSQISAELTDELVSDAECTYPGGHFHGQLLRLDDWLTPDYADPTKGLFDAVFDMPPSAIGNGQIIQPVEGGRLVDSCPGHGAGTCRLYWHGTVALTRSDYTPAPGSDPAPAASRPAPPVDGGIVKRTSEAIDHWLEQQRQAGEIEAVFQRAGRRARVELTCPGACSGVVQAYARAAGLRLSSGSFAPVGRGSAAPGRSAKGRHRVAATIAFDAADRRAIRRRRGITLKLTMRFGDRPLQRVSLRLKAPRRVAR